MHCNEDRHEVCNYSRWLRLRLDFWPTRGTRIGDAPWCAVTQLGEGVQAWDCHFDTVEECVPAVVVGNRGNCTPNPYYSPPPAIASVPGAGPTNTTPGVVENRKSQKDAR